MPHDDPDAPQKSPEPDADRRTVLILRDGRLYRPGGIFGTLTFVNYGHNVRFYPHCRIVNG